VPVDATDSERRVIATLRQLFTGSSSRRILREASLSEGTLLAAAMHHVHMGTLSAGVEEDLEQSPFKLLPATGGGSGGSGGGGAGGVGAGAGAGSAGGNLGLAAPQPQLQRGPGGPRPGGMGMGPLERAVLALEVDPNSPLGGRVVAAARRWDASGAPGVHASSLVHAAVVGLMGPGAATPLATSAALMGDGLGAAGGAGPASCSEVVGGRGVVVHQVGMGDVLRGGALRGAATLLADAVAPAALGPVPPGCLRLYHGTSLVAASAILRDGVNWARLSLYCDFGQAWYFTPDFPYALVFANERYLDSIVEGDLPAVIAIDVGEEVLRAGFALLDLRGHVESWVALVDACHRLTLAKLEARHPDLHAAFHEADVVVGATAVPVRHGGPLPSSNLQFAVRKAAASARLVQEAENVQVLRVAVARGDLGGDAGVW
jgi:hypothetical protein